MEGFDFKWVLDSFYLLVFSDEWLYTTTQHTTTQPTNQPTNNKTLGWAGGKFYTAHTNIHAATPAGWLGETKKYARLVTIQQQPFMGWMVRHTQPNHWGGRSTTAIVHHTIMTYTVRYVCCLVLVLVLVFKDERRKSIKKKA
jgi:hypothetical protein